jgi:hypothetical protein
VHLLRSVVSPAGFPFKARLGEGGKGGALSLTILRKQVVWSVGTAWIPRRGHRGQASRANFKKDLVTGPIPGFCALLGCERRVRDSERTREADSRTE